MTTRLAAHVAAGLAIAGALVIVRPGMEEAHATGGQAYIGTNDLNSAADKVLAEASNYYLIGVKAPPVGKTAELRDIQVKIKRRGVTVRTREAVSGGR